MMIGMRRVLVPALLGLVLGIGLVVALYRGGDALRRPVMPAPATDAPRDPVAALSPPQDPARVPAPFAAPGGSREGGDASPGTDAQAGPAPVPAAEASAPRFDIVRVEPNGESVVAGRAKPGSVVELMVDGKPVAQATADANGQFALVPPPLPPGNSEIALRATDAAGRAVRSRDSVAVAVAPAGTTKPLVALTSPDRPTVVLSQPEASAAPAAGGRMAASEASRPGAVPGGAAKGRSSAGATAADKDAPGDRGAGPRAGGMDRTGGGEAGRTAPAAERKTAPAAEGKAAPVKIVSVDAQEGGRLFVTGHAAAGSTVRLYLNDTLIAPANVGRDGSVTFTIGRGVKPGAYRIRLDQVEAGSGKVRHRVEVPFTVPEPARIAATDRPAAPAPKAAAGPPNPAAAGSEAARPQIPATAPAAPEVRPAETAPSRQASAALPKTSPTTQPRTSPTPPPATAAAPAAKPEAAPPRPAPATPAAVAPAANPADVFVPAVNTARIVRGDNLWVISRRTYGAGDRYTVIYDANQEQIRNPDLIYPGQIFVLPADGKDAKAGKDG